MKYAFRFGTNTSSPQAIRKAAAKSGRRALRATKAMLRRVEPIAVAGKARTARVESGVDAHHRRIPRYERGRDGVLVLLPQPRPGVLHLPEPHFLAIGLHQEPLAGVRVE